MKKSQTKLFGSVASSLLLVGAGAAVAAPALAAADTTDAVAQEVATDVQAAEATRASIANVQGEFAYTQSAVTPTASISGVFSKAAAALCTNLPTYTATVSSTLHITGGVTMDATVAELQEDQAAQSVLMACACASNVAGGGAVANAEVSGVTLAGLATLAQAI